MIKRDEFGIVCQNDIYDLNYCDGGDSSARVGILALCGFWQDQLNLDKFVTDGRGTRHPYQVPFNDSRSWSRDQLIQYTAGLHGLDTRKDAKLLQTFIVIPKGSDIARSLFWSHTKRLFFCQNILDDHSKPKKFPIPDILTPSHISHLIRVAKLHWLYPFFIIGYPWLVVDILYSCTFGKNMESNQVISMAAVAGNWALRLYTKLHPNYKATIRNYWGTEEKFRYQPEIGEALIDYIERRLK